MHARHTRSLFKISSRSSTYKPKFISNTVIFYPHENGVTAIVHCCVVIFDMVSQEITILRAALCYSPV